MRRTTYGILALSLFSLALPAMSPAVPILVEMKLRDPLSAVNSTVPTGDDQLVVSGNAYGKDKSNEKGKSNESGNGSGSKKENPGQGGKPDDPLANGNLKSLTLWLSTNGKDWKELGGEIVDLSSGKITARVDSKGNVSLSEAMSTFGLPTSDISGQTSSSYYIGVSTGSKSFSSGAYSAELVSWQYFTPNHELVRLASIPEPAMWPLFTMGLLGVGLVVGTRKKR